MISDYSNLLAKFYKGERDKDADEMIGFATGPNESRVRGNWPFAQDWRNAESVASGPDSFLIGILQGGFLWV